MRMLDIFFRMLTDKLGREITQEDVLEYFNNHCDPDRTMLVDISFGEPNINANQIHAIERWNAVDLIDDFKMWKIGQQMRNHDSASA